MARLDLRFLDRLEVPEWLKPDFKSKESSFEVPGRLTDRKV